MCPQKLCLHQFQAADCGVTLARHRKWQLLLIMIMSFFEETLFFLSERL